MRGYCLEFILNTYDTTPKMLEEAMRDLGEGLEITAADEISDTQAKNFIIRIQTHEPTIIFDACAQFGRIKSIKIDETK